MTFALPQLDSPNAVPAWQALDALAALHRSTHIADLLARHPGGRSNRILTAAGLEIDFSRQRLPSEALAALNELASATGIPAWRDAMFDGKAVNTGEGRAALHTALRDPDGLLHPSVGEAALSTVRDTLATMTDITDAVHSGAMRGASGRPFSDVLHIGIGGSQLGPQLACEALEAFAHPRLRCHFLGNIDPDAQRRVLRDLNPLTTLVIVASKSWRTVETVRNAQAIRAWLSGAGVGAESLGRHLIAVTSNERAAIESGVLQKNILACPDWVGGRFSVWGAVGLPVMLGTRSSTFREMLAGAHDMDRHFRQSPLAGNVPLQLALTSLWNAMLLRSGSEAVIAYSDALRSLATHLQQVQMESCGKSVDRSGRALQRPTVPVIWGESGTESQHSFFQALHQGVQAHPAELIVVGGSHDEDAWQRGVALRANALAQAQALALGHQDGDAQRVHPGNRPTILIHLPRLDPRHFGALIALYEHKTACLGWLWGLNPFDQWGVELGKRLAVSLEPQLSGAVPLAGDLDSATAASLTRMRSTTKR